MRAYTASELIRPMFGPSGVSIGADAAVVRRMHVAHFEAGALARQAARAERRDATLVRDFRQRVVLVHELRQLRGAEELLDRGRHGLGVDQFLRRQAFRLRPATGAPCTARSTRTRPMRNTFSAISPTERTRRLPRWSMSSTVPRPLRISMRIL